MPYARGDLKELRSNRAKVEPS